MKFIVLTLRLCTEVEETAVPERPQVIIFATFQGVPKNPPRVTRLNELVSRFISCSATDATVASFVLKMMMIVISIQEALSSQLYINAYHRLLGKVIWTFSDIHSFP